MNKFQTFQEYLATQSTQVPVLTFVFNLALSAALAIILGHFYVRYGRSLSNRKMFARNFLMLTMTTMIIITIVKSSLALSLGLVGALSIVRFRAAIKEPEELTFLFYCIAIGLGLGADQTIISLVAFVSVITAIWLRRDSGRREENQDLFLTVSIYDSQEVELGEIVKILKNYCSEVYLKRFDHSKKILEASFIIEFENFSKLEDSQRSLNKLSDSVKITLLDNKGIGG